MENFLRPPRSLDKLRAALMAEHAVPAISGDIINNNHLITKPAGISSLALSALQTLSASLGIDTGNEAEVAVKTRRKTGKKERSAEKQKRDAFFKEQSLLTKQLKEPKHAAKDEAGRAEGKKPARVDRPPKVICKYWMEGRCQKGAACTFSHDIAPNKTPEEARSAESCRYYMAGSCIRGDTCLYSHDLSTLPCRFWHGRGECSAGEQCRYSHADVSDEVKAELMLQMRKSIALQQPVAELPPRQTIAELAFLQPASDVEAMMRRRVFSVPKIPNLESLI